MTQSTLDQWFTVKTIPNQNCLRKVFYCDWTDVQNPIIQWSHSSENFKDANFEHQIKWKKQKITIIGKFSEDNYLLPTETKYLNLSFLKSHLQKTVRRREHEKAIKTAWHMIKLDLLGFLRRLTIIMVEDVSLHESFGIVVWLIAAISSKKYPIPKYQIEWLLGIVHVLCEIDTKEKSIFTDQEINVIEANTLSQDRISLLYSISFRISFGGMKVDTRMLKGELERFFSTDNKCNQIKIRPISSTLDDLELEDWTLAALDFHCSPYMIKWIIEKYPHLDGEMVECAIWHHSSKINVRIKTKEHLETKEIWNKIRKDVYSMQKYILAHYVSV